MYICDYCQKKFDGVSLVCLNCFFPPLQLQSFRDLQDYLESAVQLRNSNLSGLELWALREAISISSQDLEQRLIESGELYNPIQLPNGYWQLPTGFISRENPGPMSVTSLGFMSPLEFDLSEEAQEYLTDLALADQNKELAKGFVEKPGVCPSCASRIKITAIHCPKCFGPCIPMNSYDARAAYGESMERAGKRLATKDSAKFELWRQAMEASLEMMQGQIEDLRPASKSLRESLRSAQLYWLIAIPSSIVFGLLTVLIDEKSLNRWNTGVWGLAGALLISLIVFFNIYVKCPNCGKNCEKNSTRLERNFVGSQVGTHTEYRTSTTYSHFNDNRGREIGTATSYSSTPERVEHIEDVYSDLYQCTYCAQYFRKQVVQRQR